MLQCFTQTVCSRITRRSKCSNSLLCNWTNVEMASSPINRFVSKPCMNCGVFFFRDKMHVDWVKAYLSIWAELQAYIKQHHTTGLAWSKSVRESFFPPVLSFSLPWSILDFLVWFLIFSHDRVQLLLRPEQHVVVQPHHLLAPHLPQLTLAVQRIKRLGQLAAMPSLPQLTKELTLLKVQCHHSNSFCFGLLS